MSLMFPDLGNDFLDTQREGSHSLSLPSFTDFKFELGNFRAGHVSHLRRSGLYEFPFPALTDWANLCRAYGAMAEGMRD